VIAHADRTLAALRSAFDDVFAAPPPEPAGPTDDFLSILAAGRRHAVRLSEIDGVFVDRRVVPVPGPSPTLLGIAAFRGVLVPVHDLRVLLGGVRGAVPRWTVLVRGVGLGFDALDRHVRVAVGEVATSEAGGVATSRHVEGLVRLPDGDLPLLNVASLLSAIAGSPTLASAPGERNR
jgi:chemotaxis signal transduction protein